MHAQRNDTHHFSVSTNLEIRQQREWDVSYSSGARFSKLLLKKILGKSQENERTYEDLRRSYEKRREILSKNFDKLARKVTKR